MAVKDGKLSDGTVIPKGYYVALDSDVVLMDPELYEDPHTFDPFRFSRPREQGVEDPKQHTFTSIDKSVSFRFELALLPVG